MTFVKFLSSQNIKFFSGVCLIVLTAVLEPVLLFAVLTVFLFLILDFYLYILLVLLAAFFLKSVPGFDLYTTVFVLLFAAAYFIKQKMPWRDFITLIVFLTIIPVLFYFITDPGFFIHVPVTALKDIGYTIVAGAALFLLFYDAQKT